MKKIDDLDWWLQYIHSYLLQLNFSKIEAQIQLIELICHIESI